MDFTNPIPSHLLFTCHGKEALEECRRDTANFYITHGCIEYEVVTLMELAYILCIQSGSPLDDNETHAKHNRLCKILMKNSLQFRHKDLRNPPYFRNLANEYWVSPEIAAILIKECEGNEIQTPQSPQTEEINSSLCPLLLEYVRFYFKQGKSCNQYMKMMIDKKFVDNGDGEFKLSQHNSDNSHPTTQRVYLEVSYTKETCIKKYNICYRGFYKDNGANSLGEQKTRAHRTLRSYFTYVKKHDVPVASS